MIDRHFDEVMLDLETLDTRPSSVVLSVAAVPFDQHRVGPPFYRVLDLQAQISAGRTISQSTLLWWAEQGAGARAEAFSAGGRSDVRTAVRNLSTFLYEHCVHGQRVWAKGPDFDCRIWESLCDTVGDRTPWAYNAVRDVRTAADLAGLDPNWRPDLLSVIADWDPAHFVEHHPVADCLAQIGVVRAARTALGVV